MKALNRMIYRWISKRFMDGCSDYNPLTVRKASRTKQQARDIFKQLEIPHAEGLVFVNPIQALRFVKRYGFPVVVKPNVSGYSRGSHFPINNRKDLWKALLAVKIWWPSSVIEQYLKGKNYRVVVVKNEIMSVIRRYPPFVTGNGQSTIAELIEQENQVRQEMNLYPVIHPIAKNRSTQAFLKKQGYALDSIPGEGQVVELHNKVALAPGGVVETIDKRTIAPENRMLFLKTLSALDANIFGIDVILEKGIEHPYTEQNCIFLELNSRPYLKMHHSPRFGQAEDLRPYIQQLETIELADAGVF